METMMHEPIRLVISHHPAVGQFLLAQGIDCSLCTDPDCVLKDVLKIHGITGERAQVLFADIANLLRHDADKTSTPLSEETPGREPANPFIMEAPAAAPLPVSTVSPLVANMAALPGEDNPFSFPADMAWIADTERVLLSEPLQELIIEHDRILRLLTLVPRLQTRNDWWGDDRGIADGLLNLTRRYVNHFHHVKEEEILFRMVEGNHPFVQAMKAEHVADLALLKMADDGIRFGDGDKVDRGFREHMTLMRAHMLRENEVLFPWFDKVLTNEQKASLTEQFDRLDTREGSSLEGEIDAFLETAERTLSFIKPVIHPFSNQRVKTVERLIKHPDVAISHLILPAGESVDGHCTATNTWFVITHGMITVRHSEAQEEKYVQGTIVHLPANTWMELINEGPGTFEMFVVRAPNATG